MKSKTNAITTKLRKSAITNDDVIIKMQIELINREIRLVNALE